MQQALGNLLSDSTTKGLRLSTLGSLASSSEEPKSGVTYYGHSEPLPARSYREHPQGDVASSDDKTRQRFDIHGGRLIIQSSNREDRTLSQSGGFVPTFADAIEDCADESCDPKSRITALPLSLGAVSRQYTTTSLHVLRNFVLLSLDNAHP